MKKFLPITGAGGGSKSGSSTAQDPNTLLSRSYLQFMHLLCEGEIEGLVNGLQSVFFDYVPVANPDGSFNFLNFLMQYAFGTQTQSPLPGFNSIETVIPGLPVGAITAEQPQSGVVEDVNADAARVTIVAPAMVNTPINGGDISGSFVAFAIDVQSSTSGYITMVSDNFNGKCTTPYSRDYRINLPALGAGPWTIRVRRITPDSIFVNVVNDIYLGGITSLVDLKLSYPNSVVAGGILDSYYISGIPNILYDVKLLKIQIPANYNPLTWQYANSGPGTTNGVWDGTFVTAWSDNPAWVFYDLILSSRYGLGSYIDPTTIDKWTLYTIAQYCDQLVSDGYGGYERRFSCNILLENREAALRVLASLATVFRGMIYYANGTVNFFQDSPTAATASFSQANVENGLFTYSGTALSARHSVFLVTWKDPTDFCRPKIEYVQDSLAVAKFGIREATIDAFGCISRGQARRAGRWALFTEQLETETIAFTTSLDGIALYPGQIINIFDPTRAQKRLAGRIVSATIHALTIDAGIDILTGNTYTALWVDPTGAMQTAVLTNPNATGQTTLTFATPIDSSLVPAVNTPWAVSISNLAPQLFRVLSIEEGDKGKYKVGALAYNPVIYSLVEQDIPFSSIPIQGLPPMTTCQPPINPTLAAGLSLQHLSSTKASVDPTGATFVIDVSWIASPDPYISSYEVQYTYNNKAWIEAGSTSSTLLSITLPTTLGYSYQYTPLLEGTNGIPNETLGETAYNNFQVRVRAINTGGYMSNWIVIDDNESLTDLSQVNVAGTITGLEVDGQGNDSVFGGEDLTLNWRLNNPGGAGTLLANDLANPMIAGYNIIVYDMRTGTPVLLRQAKVQTTSYVYTFAFNFSDTNGNPSRNLRFMVNISDKRGFSSPYQTIDVSNPAPLLGTTTAPTIDTNALKIGTKQGNLVINYTIPNDSDFAGMAVWISTNPAFNLNQVRDNVTGTPLTAAMIPYNVAADTGMLLYAGPNTGISVPVNSTQTYYLIFAPFDRFGGLGTWEGLNYYGPTAGTVIAQLQTIDIATAAVTTSTVAINAITIPVNAVTVGPVTMSGPGTGYEQIQVAAINDPPELPIQVSFSVDVTNSGGTTGTFQLQATETWNNSLGDPPIYQGPVVTLAAGASVSVGFVLQFTPLGTGIPDQVFVNFQNITGSSLAFSVANVSLSLLLLQR